MPHSVAHRGEYIDCYSPPLTTHYGEVYWTMMAEVALPADFVARFKGKTWVAPVPPSLRPSLSFCVLHTWLTKGWPMEGQCTSLPLLGAGTARFF